MNWSATRLEKHLAWELIKGVSSLYIRNIGGNGSIVSKKVKKIRIYGQENIATQSKATSSSRSVCSNLAEGHRKRRYEAHFISKISDADMENSETQVWLDFALACGYISQKIYDELTNKSEEVGRMINHMVEHPEKYRRKVS